jgi:hypothetical protein
MAKIDQITSKDREDALKKKAEAMGLPVEELAKLMILAEIMKAPSEFEQKKADEAAEQRRLQMISAGQIEAQKVANVMAEQASCPHQRDDGKHLWSGQTIGPGNMYAKGFCVRCMKAYYWKSTPDQIANGLGLQENKGIREVNLQNEEKNNPVPPEYLMKLGDRQAAERHREYVEAKGKRVAKKEAVHAGA